MTVCTGNQRIVLYGVRLLAETGQRIIFAEKCNDRATAAGLAHHSGRDIGNRIGNPKTLRLQHLAMGSSRLRLHVAGLGRLPDLVGQFREHLRFTIHEIPDEREVRVAIGHETAALISS
ncbi:hypothetical protein D3C87_1846780 [compost metagenome]